MTGAATLLFFYLVLAVGVSFLCSLCEAALLTLSPADAEALAERHRKAGERLRAMKASIDRPLAAILTLNTIAHTIGAAGVGAQAAVVFGGWVGLTSAVLTLLILVVSEIIPKTIGAMHARRLAVPTVWIVGQMIWITYPVVMALELVGRWFKGGGHEGVPTRREIEIMAELARSGGTIDSGESRVIQNLLSLRDKKVRDVMTPRTVVFMLPASMTASQATRQHPRMTFSRIPIFGENADDIRGVVLRADILEAAIAGEGRRTLESLSRPIAAVPESASLVSVMRRFGQTGHHLFLVVDEYGGTEGVITLEDVLETMLGAEIVDEFDPAPDMRELARQVGGPDAQARRPEGAERNKIGRPSS
ncbi:MAG: HlyC/CorC family transporter [Planctomycetota bacterium]|nr:MAG: HlyC/CorC family transporter [Planctomycetota bacterium]